jgi:hypothetical protein
MAGFYFSSRSLAAGPSTQSSAMVWLFFHSDTDAFNTVAWKSEYLWFIWSIGSLVIGPSLAGSVVQAEAETIGIHPSFMTQTVFSIH